MAASKIRELLQMEKSLSRCKALRLARKIRPVMSGVSAEKLKLSLNGKPEGKKFWIGGGSIFYTSYTDCFVPIMPAESLNVVTEIVTYHECASCGSITPSVYEVLAQIPEHLRNIVTAFELYADANSWYDVYDSELDRHKLNCILYRGEIPDAVATKRVMW